jgi:hypothetical protein
MSKKRPSSMLRHGISVIHTRTGGYECLWKYYDDRHKRFNVYFQLISVNGEPVDIMSAYNKYEIPGWFGKKFLPTFQFYSRSTFNQFVDMNTIRIVEY